MKNAEVDRYSSAESLDHNIILPHLQEVLSLLSSDSGSRSDSDESGVENPKCVNVVKTIDLFSDEHFKPHIRMPGQTMKYLIFVNKTMDYSLELDPATVCRICLEPQESLLSIFTKHIIEGHIRTLPEIILSCFSVDVITNPILPKNICEGCKSSVIQFYKFKENVIRTEKLLTEIFKSDVVLKEEVFKIEEIADRTLVEADVEFEDQYVEEVQLDGGCEENLINEFEEEQQQTQIEEYETERIVQYREEDLSNMEIIDEADTAYGEFDEEAYIDDIPQNESEQEVITAEQNVDDEDSMTEIIPIKRRFRRNAKSGETKSTLTLMCKICNKRIKIDDENHDKLHDYYAMIVAPETFLQCHRCDQVFICTDELQTHLQQIHYENNDEEEDIFSDFQLLDEDLMRSVWVCGNCNTDFAELSDLKMHMVTHLAKIGCPVNHCGFQYTNFHYFYQHIRRNHLTTKLLNCKYCGESNIPDFRTLQNHYRSECTAKKFKCEYCSRTFFTDKSWKTHIEVRHIEKKFVCELCGKSFAQITELTIHTRMHTGERPFECTICRKTYKTASGRASHMDSHSNKVFPCNICGKNMNSRRNLVTHVRRHTEEKKLKCEVCGKRFFTKWHLNLHASKMHNNIK